MSDSGLETPPRNAPRKAESEVLPDGLPVGQATIAEASAHAVADRGAPARERVGKGYITLVTLAIFGAYVALVTPIAISLALKVEQLAPANPEYLGYVTGAGAIAAFVATPIIGMLSDRTRSRLGRRRPYLIAGMILGTGALLLVALAPNVVVLAIGWAGVQLTWGVCVLSGLQYSQADRLPEEQRGKVSGLVGFVQNLGPIIGAGIATAFIGQDLLLFLVPGGIGVVVVLLFVILIPEKVDAAQVNNEKLTLAKLARNLVFDPRKHASFAWNCLGRVFFNVGLAMSTTFTTFFFASRMGVNVSDIGGLVIILSIGGVLAGSLGALGGGWLSDKIKKRRLLVLVSSILFLLGVLLMAFGADVPVLLTGSIITTIAVGAFMSVDQAIVFDVLPERDTDAGRYLGINAYATSLPQAIGPLIASAVLVLGVASGEQNYTLLFLIAAAFTLIGSSIIFFLVRGTR